MKNLILTVIIALLTACNFVYEPAKAENHVIKAEGTKFTPTVLRVAVGDTVSFDNMAGHNTQTINEYLPFPGGKLPKTWIKDRSWESKMGDNYVTKPFEVEGVYFVKCAPHWSMGMGVAIIVGEGEPVNLDDVEALKPKGSAKRLVKKVKKFLKAEAK